MDKTDDRRLEVVAWSKIRSKECTPDPRLGEDGIATDNAQLDGRVRQRSRRSAWSRLRRAWRKSGFSASARSNSTAASRTRPWPASARPKLLRASADDGSTTDAC